jgi:hypothetical protein
MSDVSNSFSPCVMPGPSPQPHQGIHLNGKKKNGGFKNDMKVLAVFFGANAKKGKGKKGGGVSKASKMPPVRPLPCPVTRPPEECEGSGERGKTVLHSKV